MAENRLFATSELLDRWIATGRVELAGRVLVVCATGQRYAVEEAVRVVREVTGAGDPRGLVGRVRTVDAFTALGAEALGRGMVLGEVAYDVVPGFVLTPVTAPPGRLRTDVAVAGLSRLS